MESLRIIPNIKSLLENNREDDAVEIINKYIDTISLYLKDHLHLFKGSSKSSALCLSKIYFVLQEYDMCIDYAVKSEELFLNDNSFYFRSVVNRMLDLLRKDNNHHCQDFVIALIRNEQISESYIGYMYSIGEFEQFENSFAIYLNHSENPGKLLNFMLQLAESDNNLERFYKFIIKVNNIRKPCVYVLIDAHMYFEDTEKIKELIERVMSENILLCYDICFYIEENYKLEVCVENEKVQRILSGEFRREIFLRFLTSNNLTSFRFLDSITKTRSTYVGVINAFMNLGTTNDTFYRSNSDMFTHAKEWARFCDVSYLGMIHCNNEYPHKVLKNYLPSEVNQKEGGALLAFGLINTGTMNEEDNELLLYFLDGEETLTPELALGACIGLGLINIGSGNQVLIDILLNMSKNEVTLYAESAVYGLGLLGCKTSDNKLLCELEILKRETDFERVKRCVGLAFSLIVMMSNKKFYMENTDLDDDPLSMKRFINAQLDSKDGIDRFGGVLSLGSAYVGTGNLSVISKLLPYINDGDDDVKRAAVIGISLVCCNDTSLLIGTLEPLSENHNFFVRASVALCLGFFLSGTGNKLCCDILEALMYDSNNLVRQNACIGIGFIIAQCNPSIVSNYKRIVDQINRIIVERGEESSVKYGAILGRGISECGGRNVVFSIKNLTGKITKERVAGAILFLNHWYWYPLTCLVTLNYLPTAFFAFNEDLEEENITLESQGDYNNHLIKLPDVKKARRFKPKVIEEKEIITESPQTIVSGSRCTLLQKLELGIEDSGIIFVKKNK